MNNPGLFCFPLTENCKLMSEWAVYWQAIGIVATVGFGLVGLYKIYQELKRLNEQRSTEIEQRNIEIADKERSEKLKRTEFFLDQHRRLFDNPELFEILCLIDDDNPILAKQEMWDKKRKFLTFFEEIALLVRSGQLDKNVALYMFGYYVTCAKRENFSAGIDTSRAYWGLLHEFADDAESYLQQNTDGPPPGMTL